MNERAEDEDRDLGYAEAAALNGGGISAPVTRTRYRTDTGIWKERSTLEKYLLIISAILLLTIIALAVAIGRKSSRVETHETRLTGRDSQDEAHGKGTYCLTEQCATTVASLISNMDPSVDPCDDFYEYACGGWKKRNPIPEGMDEWNRFHKLERDNQLVVRNVLEKPLYELKSRVEKTAKRYYSSCMDADKVIEALGARPMLELLEDVGGWNISGRFNISTWSLQNSMHVLQDAFNMDGLFSWSVISLVAHEDRSDKEYVIKVDQEGLSLPFAFYLNETQYGKILTSYLDYMTKIGVLLGGEQNLTRKQMQDIIVLETRLAEITVPSEDDLGDKRNYAVMSLDDLQRKAPFISWMEFFRNATYPVANRYVNGRMTIVNVADYFGNLTKVVQEYNETTTGRIVLNNYLVWQTVRRLTKFLSKPFREAFKEFQKAIPSFTERREEQWRYCVDGVNDAMGFVVGAMFVREVFQNETRSTAEEMINHIRQTFTNNLKDLNWMDAETRSAVEEKANAIVNVIGFQDFVMRPSEIEEYYSGLSFKEYEYFQNILRLQKHNLRKNVERLNPNLATKEITWMLIPSAVNAHYTSNNELIFPAGILQNPFYDMKSPNSLNYGSMGVLMGHELIHAFNHYIIDNGINDLREILYYWWDYYATLKQFKHRAKCFVEQYNRYQVEGLHAYIKIDGEHTLDENIADSGGLKTAYFAYLAAPKSYEDQLPLPGLNLTHRQLFFLSFAQTWCSSVSPQTIVQTILDDHSPSKYRVIGPLSNMPEFAAEFDCPRNSRMNPAHKCAIW